MKLTVFPSDKGDCLLLTSNDGASVLVDGGMGTSYSRYVAPELAKMASEDKKLDVVYVSHIDEDHISGILKLVDDAFAWKVFDIHLDGAPDDGVSDAGDGFRRPKDRPRPPAIGKFWYNAFHAMIPDPDGDIDAGLIQAATALAAADNAELRGLALANRELVTSIRQGILLTNRLDTGQLGFDVNPEAKGGLMQIELGKPQSRQSPSVGSMTFFVIGPFREDLDNLRDEWKQWVKDNKEKVRQLEEMREADERRLLPNEFERLLQGLIARAGRLGDRDKVTVPNLASLMFLVEEGGATVLLTGDGHGADILKGLAEWGKLDANGGIHVDVLKVQHHGSENNLDAEFCRRVTADQYVFCGNGAHENPDLRVLETIANSRTGAQDVRSPNPQADNRLTFWFNNSPTFEANPIIENKQHMERVEEKVKKLAQASGGKMSFKFIGETPRLEIAVGA